MIAIGGVATEGGVEGTARSARSLGTTSSSSKIASVRAAGSCTTWL